MPLLAEGGKLEAAAASLVIPESVREVIDQRLDRLPEEAIEVLTLAALAGREFELALVRELTGRDEDALLDLLGRAVSARLLEEVEGRAGRYRFAHGLTREVLTGELSTTRRVRLHARIGEALEKLYGVSAERHAVELAYHFGQAASVSGVPDKAVRYLAMAARAAAATYAYEDAIRHCEEALGLITEVEQDPALEAGRRLG